MKEIIFKIIFMVTLIGWAISCDKPVVASDEDNIKNGQRIHPDTSDGSHMQKNETPAQEQHQDQK